MAGPVSGRGFPRDLLERLDKSCSMGECPVYFLSDNSYVATWGWHLSVWGFFVRAEIARSMVALGRRPSLVSDVILSEQDWSRFVSRTDAFVRMVDQSVLDSSFTLTHKGGITERFARIVRDLLDESR